MSVISLANVSSHSIGCLFVLLIVSFAVQKLLSLTGSHSFIFVFVSFALGDRSTKILLCHAYVFFRSFMAQILHLGL